MRILMSSAVAVAIAVGSTSVAGAAQCTMSGMMGHGASHMMPKCTAKTGPVVWFIAAAKTYYLKGSAHYGKGMGTYVCRATAVARGGHPGAAGPMGGPHAMPGAMPSAMTMAPRPMTSAPMASPVPRSSGNPMSGNQGNTGAPGAGGQVPNNPASTPNPSPSPRP
jgi:hypothetical protein